MVSSPCCPPCELGGASYYVRPRSSLREQKVSDSEICTLLGHQLTALGGGGSCRGRGCCLITFSAVCKALRCCCYPPSWRERMHFQQGIN